MSAIDDAIKANQIYGHEFTLGRLAASPTRKLAVLACMDARLSLESMLGLKPGEANIIRNAGGVVTEDVVRSLIVSQQLLGTQEVMIINHTDCGMLNFKEQKLRDGLIRATGKMAVVPVQFHGFSNLEQNVREQVHKLKAHPWIPQEISIRGFIYDVKSGLLREVSVGEMQTAA